MTYYRIAPPRALQHLVESFSYWEGGEPSKDRMAVMASRTVSLQIDLHDDELRWYERRPRGVHIEKGLTVAGTQRRAFDVDAWQPKIVRVTFKPGGARPFLGIPLAELRDAHVSLDHIWGQYAGQLQHRLVEAKGVAAVFSVLAEELVQALARIGFSTRPVVARALAVARDAPGSSVMDLAKCAGVDAKRLIRLFVDDVGLTPKLYLRIARFERLLSDVFSRRCVDWAMAANEHGYFDQSHLIRDFREFADMTPTEYLTRRGPAAHHARA